MKAIPEDAAQAWSLVVSLVMETRCEWRRKVTEATGLPFSRVRALRRLRRAPRMLCELAEDLTIDAPAATVLVNDLEARGLVERQLHPEDRRAKLVSLTAEGRRVIAALNRIADPPPPVFRAMPPALLARLRHALGHVRAED